MRFDKKEAYLDLLQSGTGIFLALFIMGHLVFEASILISNEMMYKVTLMFEGFYLFGERHAWIISVLAGIVLVVFITHALIALRRFPADYKRYKIIKHHTKSFAHEDTTLWSVQVATGFMMFFLGSVHLVMMISTPDKIGPFLSSYRVVHEYMWVVYFLLLLSVVTHAFIGLYRVMLKWGIFESDDPKTYRKLLKSAMRGFIVLYLFLGLASLAKYSYIGMTHNYEKTKIYKEVTQ